MSSLVTIASSISPLASAAGPRYKLGKLITLIFLLVRYLCAWILRVCLRHYPWIEVWPHRKHAAWPTAVGARHLILTRRANREAFPT